MGAPLGSETPRFCKFSRKFAGRTNKPSPWDECLCQSVTTSTLAEPKTVPPGFLKSTKTSLLGLCLIAAVAVTKMEKVAFASDANGDSVTVDAGAARHWPEEGFVWQMVT